MTVVAQDEKVQIDRLTLGPWGTNTYIISCLELNDCAIVDAPGDADKLIKALNGRDPKFILMTHNHMDHTGSLEQLRDDLEIPVCVHEADADGLPITPDIYLTDTNSLTFGMIKVSVIHTPGHTPGSVCYKVGDYLISGDSLFDGGPGHTGSAAAFNQIVESLTTKLFTLPDDMQVFPGHGESTVLKKEKDEYAVFASKSHNPGLCGDIVWLKS